VLARLTTKGSAVTYDDLLAAVELHRPQLMDKHAHPTTDPAKIVHRRCGECRINIPVQGCPTWERGKIDA